MQLGQLGRVMIPVTDQDAAIAFYTEKLGFRTTADAPFGDGERWVEVAPPAGGAAIALTPVRGGEWVAGRMTGIALSSGDARADHSAFRAAGVDVDPEIVGGGGGVPAMFFFRDGDGNTLMVVEG